MQIFLSIVNLLGVIGVWVFVFWFGHSIKNLKSITVSMKNVFDAMKSSSEYVANVQSIVQKLYDPEVVEKVVNLRVQAIELELLNKVRVVENEATQAKGTVVVLHTQQEHLIPAIAEYMERANEAIAAYKELAIITVAEYKKRVNEVIQQQLFPYVQFSGYASVLLDFEKVDAILARFENPDAKALVKKFVYDLKMEIDKG